jgi:hypothetical protein
MKTAHHECLREFAETFAVNGRRRYELIVIVAQIVAAWDVWVVAQTV